MPTDHRSAPLGIFGGTFDPIHHAHLRLALEAREALGLDGVRLIPAGRPSHRGPAHASAEARLDMVRRATAGLAGFEVDDAEVRSDTPSYTVPTLERLRGELGAARPLVLLLGADAFAGLPRWHRWTELLQLAHLAVATRPGYTLDECALDSALAALLTQSAAMPGEPCDGAPAGRIFRFDLTPLDISATAIRAALAAGRSPRFLVPEGVLNYIEDYSLYRKEL